MEIGVLYYDLRERGGIHLIDMDELRIAVPVSMKRFGGTRPSLHPRVALHPSPKGFLRFDL